MAHVPSIEKRFLGSKNSSGLIQEIEASSIFHAKGIPVLVSPILLRTRGMGQVDLARLFKDDIGWILEVREVKSSMMGEEVLMKFQRGRILNSLNFLTSLFGVRGKVSVTGSQKD